jgi:hypothetical protein
MGGKETLALSHAFYVSDTCPYDSEWHAMFILFTLMAVTTIFVMGVVGTSLIIAEMNGGSTKRYTTTYHVLKEILAKTDLEERNEAFLDACVEYSKKQFDEKEPEFDREFGFGMEEEVYSHYIKMEYKRLEESGKAEVAGGIKAPEEETASEEKIATMV